MIGNKAFKLLVIFLSTIMMRATDSIDVASMLCAINMARYLPDDLPDMPTDDIMRNVQAIVVPPLTITVAVPDIICGGTFFQVTATISNPTGAASPFLVTTFLGLVPANPNVTFISAAPNFGVFANVGTAAPCVFPGTGTWTIASPVPANTTFTIVINLLAAAVGAPVAVTTSSLFNTSIPSANCITNFFTIVPSPVANPFVGGSCSNSIVGGNLTATGGTPPYFFVITAFPPPDQGTLLLLDPTTGAIQFTPNPGFGGVASFQFIVVDNNGCVSNTAIGNITVSQIPTAGPINLTSCNTRTITGSVAPFVFGGTPPYTFTLTGGPFGGFATLDPVTGDFTISVEATMSATASFIYTATDVNGCEASNVVTANFLIDSPNPFVGAYQIVYVGVPCT